MFENDTRCDRSLDHSYTSECKFNFLTNCDCNKIFCFPFFMNFQNQKYNFNAGCDISENIRSVLVIMEKSSRLNDYIDFGFLCILLTKTCDILTRDKYFQCIVLYRTILLTLFLLWLCSKK